MKKCKQCKTQFEVTDSDRDFYDRVSPSFNGKKYLIPEPTHCPDCRARRRLAFRNERSLYHRKCDLTGENIISIYSPDKINKIYSPKAWYSDDWDPLDYGRNFDFSLPFFQQFKELLLEVPLISLWIVNCINADFNNNCFELKDSYLNANTDRGERNFYSYCSEYCNDISDCSFTQHSELCYECIDTNKGYNCYFSQNLDNCSDIYFSSNLLGCRYCFGCDGLNKKNYHIFNKEVSRAEWENKMNDFNFTAESIEENKKIAKAVSQKTPKRSSTTINCENAEGNYLYNCKNILNSFDVMGGEDLKNVIYSPFGTRHVQDAYAVGDMSWNYEIIGGAVDSTNCAFISNPANGPSFSYYCIQCINGTSNCFGSVALKKKKYCILNKQYTKEEYESLLPKIIEHMKKNEEWGEFFSPSLSPFGYNETLAQELYPDTEKNIISKGFNWSYYKNPSIEAEKKISAIRLPDRIEDIPDDILNWAIECRTTKKFFKITPQELRLYRRMKLPIPRICPDQRHMDRMTLRNPRKLFDRKCAKCSSNIQTTYSSERPEQVYCEDCYLKEVY